jgi:hypothetical protein
MTERQVQLIVVVTCTRLRRVERLDEITVV